MDAISLQSENKVDRRNKTVEGIVTALKTHLVKIYFYLKTISFHYVVKPVSAKW
jgi:hypothetical protein